MAEAPERLWLWPAEPEDGVDKFVSFPDQPYPSGSTEYIRAEKAEAELAAVEALRADVKGWAENAVEAWRLMREAEAERDRLAAELAAAQQREAKLREAGARLLGHATQDMSEQMDAWDAFEAALSNNGRGE